LLIAGKNLVFDLEWTDTDGDFCELQHTFLTVGAEATVIRVTANITATLLGAVRHTFSW